MKVGITGTRNGLSDQQLIFVRTHIPWKEIKEMHTGDCIGVDEQLFHHGAAAGIKQIGHPPIKDDVRAFCSFDVERELKNYFARNRDIVDESEVLYGFPPTEEDAGKGGTWYTINYGRKVDKPVYIVTPSGNVITYNVTPE